MSIRQGRLAISWKSFCSLPIGNIAFLGALSFDYNLNPFAQSSAMGNF
jgi:hypothetical protein